MWYTYTVYRPDTTWEFQTIFYIVNMYFLMFSLRSHHRCLHSKHFTESFSGQCYQSQMNVYVNTIYETELNKCNVGWERERKTDEDQCLFLIILIKITVMDIWVSCNAPSNMRLLMVMMMVMVMYCALWNGLQWMCSFLQYNPLTSARMHAA